MLIAALRWMTGLSVLATAGVLIALPAVGLCLGMPREPVVPPIARRPAPQHEGNRLVTANGYRESVGQIQHIHLSGSAAELGAAQGALVPDLVAGLEGDLVGTFIERVPFFAARHLILGLVGVNNRTLVDHLTIPEQTEILAEVRSADPRLDPWRALGEPWQRALHYHALHDVSQYLIDNPLVRPIQVGCSAFAVEDRHTHDGHLIVGRLFDFEGGPRFDLDKVVFTVAPSDGLRFVHIAWGGMTGGVTGFNEAGLWVSINAADTAGMRFCGRPIVMVVREILQHCRTIDEAVAVLARSDVFVSDGVLLASRPEHRAVVVEKGPTGQAVRAMEDGALRSTNHFLDPHWAGDAANNRRIARGTTNVRYARLGELLAAAPVDPARAVTILRDHRGAGDREVGFNNRSTINAWIGAHLAVCDLDRGIMWVSEPRHGLGMMRAFTLDGPLPAEDLPADPELERCQRDLPRWLAVRDELRGLLAKHKPTDPVPSTVAPLLAELHALNPNSFETHWLAGLASTDPGERTRYLRAALALQPAYPEDAEAISAALGGTPGAGSSDHRD